MKILLSVALLLAGAAPALSDEMPGPPPSPERVAQRAQEDPEGYREVLISCAAYRGVMAIQAGEDEPAAKQHNDWAITLLTAAGMAVPDEADAANELYADHVKTMKDELDADSSGQVEKDMNNLGQVCAPIEPYAKQQVDDALAEEAASGDEPPAS